METASLSPFNTHASVKSSSARSRPPLEVSRLTLLGINFSVLSLAEALDVMDRIIADRLPRQVSFSNAYTVTLCQRNKELRNTINQSDLTFADGMSIVWGARWLNLRLPGRVAGPDLSEALCQRAAQKGYRVFLLGSSSGNLDQLKATLKTKFPALDIAGTYSPPYCKEFSEEESLRMIQAFNDTGSDILFMGISCPKQEKWLANNLHRIKIPLCLGVGAAFDFISGKIPRAPRFLQKMGLEWLHRLFCEPRRLWKRYLLGNFVFLTLLLRDVVLFKIFNKSANHVETTHP